VVFIAIQRHLMTSQQQQLQQQLTAKLIRQIEVNISVN